jgi:hypothetical protein
MAQGEPADRDILLALVESRVQRYAQTKDSAEVLGDEAAAEAAALLAVVGWDLVEPSSVQPDIEAVAAVAWLYWCRAHCPDTVDDEADLRVAVPLFADLHPLVPDELPPVLRAQLAEAETISDGVLLYRQWQASDDAQLLDAAIDVLRAEAVGSGNGPRRLSNLAGALRERFLLASDTADIDEAVAAATESLRWTDERDPERAVRLSNQGAVLLARFDAIGQAADLSAAVDALRAATTAAEDGVYQSNLAAALISRYTVQGETADLDSAVDAARAALGAADRD